MVYTGRTPRPVYRCDNPNLLLGLKRCTTFGGFRPDKLIADAVFEAVAPFAIEAAIKARSMLNQEAVGVRDGVAASPVRRIVGGTTLCRL